MQAEFWLEKWAQPKQGWVQEKVNSRLVRYWSSLGLEAQASVLVPLCGDSIDLDWLVASGHSVCGAELSQSAIEAWCMRHGLALVELVAAGTHGSPSRCTVVAGDNSGNESSHFVQLDSGSATAGATTAKPLQVAPHFLCGDFLKLKAGDLPDKPQAVYDRAALIALPPEMRKLYAAKLEELLQPGSRILLITLAYDQQKMKGPPFSVVDEEVENLFGLGFTIEQLGASSGSGIVGNLSERGLDTASESVFMLTRN